MPHTRVLVAGGGPAGSLTAAMLAREGMAVTLVEKEEFPRYHIGESLLTSALPTLGFVGAAERVAAHGFVRKYGGYFRMKQGEVPGHIDFTTQGKYRHSYQVVRSEFDNILFDHARSVGANVNDRTAVTDVDFDEGRPVAATLRQPDGSTGRISFDYLVDATGQSGLLSARYFKDRRAEETFANVAVGTYFRGAKVYRDIHGAERPGAFSMEALTDGSGWTWAIPLHGDRLSVGVVVHRDVFRARRYDLGSDEAVFADGLSRSPDVTSLLEYAERDGQVRVWRDYSYFAANYAGPGYRLVGDAAGFIDPLFSTGVHMACMGALSAAATICSEIRCDHSAEALERFHHGYLAQAYTRLIITVAGFYRQLRNQDEIVLPGVSSEDFQRAFDLIQPVVSGDMDLDSDEVSADEVDRAMRYTADMMREAHGLSTNNRVAKFMTTMDDERLAGRLAAVDGMYIRMVRGRLGVARLGAVESALSALRRRVIRRLVSTKR
nr:NAD(P)/FAD-dependent oxidoreductase [Kibdelosporangium sp. MJ126-NF4]